MNILDLIYRYDQWGMRQNHVGRRNSDKFDDPNLLLTSHCCPRFATGDVPGIEKILRNMAHMSNIFSHRVGTEDWSQYCKRT